MVLAETDRYRAQEGWGHSLVPALGYQKSYAGVQQMEYTVSSDTLSFAVDSSMLQGPCMGSGDGHRRYWAHKGTSGDGTPCRA